MFGGKAADLEQLSQEEISETFAGTDIVDVVLEPDTTVLDALKMAKVLLFKSLSITTFLILPERELGRYETLLKYYRYFLQDIS